MLLKKDIREKKEKEGGTFGKHKQKGTIVIQVLANVDDSAQQRVKKQAPIGIKVLERIQ